MDLLRVLDELSTAESHGLRISVTVVDCSGIEKTVAAQIAASSVPTVVIDAGGNVGFGPAANLGVAVGRARVVAFMNPDIALDVPRFADLVRAGASKGAVAWSGILRNSDGTVQRNAAPAPSLCQLSAEYLIGLDTRYPAPEAEREVSVLTGALLLVDRAAFDAAGGFSPQFPLYMEDVDLSERLSKRGRLVHYPIEVARHVGGRSARHAPRETWTLLHASRVAFFARRGALVGTVARWAVLVGLAARAVIRDRRTLPWLHQVVEATARDFPLDRLLPPPPGGSGAAVTVVVLALNEESRIEPTLRSARDAGYPVLVVDGGSSDRTVEVAKHAGCEVRVRPFENFADQRNWAFDHVDTSHVLFVDADELIHPSLAEEVAMAVDGEVDGAWVPTLDYFAGRWMLHGGWYPQPHLRLLRRSAARFEGAVHERVRFVTPAAKVVWLGQPLLHRSHLTVSDYLRKLDRYTDIESDEVRGSPTVLVLRGVAEAGVVLVRRLFVQSGWRDGPHGVVGAVLYATYRFSIYAKAATARQVDPETPEAALARLDAAVRGGRKRRGLSRRSAS